MEIYEKIRYYHEHTDYSQRKVAQILSVSRNTVKKYWEGQTVPWERKPGSGRKNDIITDEVKASYKYKRALYKIVMILHRAYIRFGHSWFADKISVVLNRYIFLPYG